MANNTTWIGTADIEPSLLKDLPKTDQQFLAGQSSHLVWTRHDPNPIEFDLPLSVYLERYLASERVTVAIPGRGVHGGGVDQRGQQKVAALAFSLYSDVAAFITGNPLDGGALQVSY
jgi:hypothetical protein